MYGGFGFMGRSDVFEKDEVKMEDVLNDDGVVYSLDDPNKKCKEFFTDERVKELIDYIITMPENDKDKNKAFKFPFNAAKMLASNCPIFFDFFFREPPQKKVFKDSIEDEFEAQVLLVEEDKEDEFTFEDKKDEKKKEKRPLKLRKENLDYLFKFLNIDDEINYVLSGYFTKVIISFLEGESKKLLLEYFFEDPAHSENLIKHIYCKSIASALTSFLNFTSLEDKKNNSLNLGDIGLGNTFNLHNGDKDENKEEKKEDLDQFTQDILETRIKIFKALINRLLASTDLEVIANIKDLFSDLFLKCNEVSNFELLYNGIFCDKDTIDTIFKCMYLRGKRNRTKVSIIASIFSNALENLYEIGFKTDHVKVKLDNDVLITSIAESIPRMVNVVKWKLENMMIQTTTFGKECHVLGVKVLNIYDLFFSFFSLNSTEINNAFAASDFLNVSMDIFCSYPWNNVYHCKFMKIFKFYLNSPIDSKLFAELTKENNFAKFLLRVHRRSTVHVALKSTSKKSLGYGFTGYLRELGNQILQLEDEEKKKKIVECDEWSEFLDLHLTERNEFLSKDRDDVFNIKDKKDSWMGGDLDDDDIMNELNNGSLNKFFGEDEKDDKKENVDGDESEDFMSEGSEPGSILDAIKNSHMEEKAAEEKNSEFTVSKHFSKKTVEPSEELIDSLLAEIEG